MCHDLTREEWQLLLEEEQRVREEPRTVEVVERENVEAEREQEPERELVHA